MSTQSEERTEARDNAPMEGSTSIVYHDQVRLNHTDAFGVLYWGSATLWAQRGMEELFERFGHPLFTYLNDDVDYVVRRAEIDYLAPLTLGTSVTIETSIIKVGTSSFTAQTRVSAQAGLSLIVNQVMVCYDRSRGEAVPVEDWLRALGPTGTA